MKEKKENEITVDEILSNPFHYMDMIVQVTYKTSWINRGSFIEQYKAFYKGRILFISERIIQFRGMNGEITVQHANIISIEKCLQIAVNDIVAENIKLKETLTKLKSALNTD